MKFRCSKVSSSCFGPICTFYLIVMKTDRLCSVYTTMEYRLSLVAQFDDLGRKRSVLCSGSENLETEFYKFVKHQEICRQKWMEAERRVKDLEQLKANLREQNAKLETKLMHAKSQIDIEIRKRLKLEADKNSMDNTIKLVREILLEKNNQSFLNPRDRERLAFLSTDFGGPSNYGDSPGYGLSTIEESQSSIQLDLSYDNTGDDLDASFRGNPGSNRKKRPSAPPVEEEELTPHSKKRSKAGKSPSKSRKNKKHRRSNSASLVTTTTITVQNGQKGAKAHLTHDDVKQNDSMLRKCPSAGDISIVHSDDETTPRTGQFSKDARTPGRPSSLYRTSSAWSLNRPHDFVKTAVLKPEQCSWRERKKSCSGIRCRKDHVAISSQITECKATAHQECRDLVPIPCVPYNITPGLNKHDILTISDYAPLQRPYIPALVIHCIKEIEARGFGNAGLYRECGNEREVKQLKADFLKHRGLPNLSTISDINVICGCLKDFLRGLKEPLITPKHRDEFIKAANNEDEDEALSGIIQAISHLPNANRDTLAFIILHLQKISESDECRMTISSLAIVFGPTVVGYSEAEPDHMLMLKETKDQAKVMERLITISHDYWERLINPDDNCRTPADYYSTQTPDALRSLLGPVGTPDTSTVDKNRNTWNTPRFGSVSMAQRRNITHFFTSPIQ
ncbi:hypothetical protein LSH36_357g00003 [Paralvinella palmiformis]|uniref:Rho-GAP domain-containing protein n=1 Tax=Paralvinella palmiformis TaxID=53620 RepID=A0AAD9N1I1_9ANNE|nr:hypothetical protein LSH36_357g00003 [Paralvinella palmiformis]